MEEHASGAPQSTVTAWMIVRDEAANLPDCLASLVGFADRVIVVDTGSKDATVEIAERAGAEVHHVPWLDDFSAARNAALDFCSGDWLLWIDADERLGPCERSLIHAVLSDEGVLAARVRLRRRVGFTPCWEVRLFRPHAEIRFEGSVHGDIADAVGRVAVREGLTIVDLPIDIDHFGYEGDQSARHRRNLVMLRARLEREPENVFCLTHLGQTLEALGETDASEETYERVVGLISRTAHPIPQAWLAYDALIRARLGRGEDVVSLLEERADAFAHLPAYQITCVQTYLALGDPAAAIPHLEMVCSIDIKDHVGIGVGLPEDLFGGSAWTMLGECRFELGDFAGAADAFEEAYRLEPTMERKAKATVARGRVGRG